MGSYAIKQNMPKGPQLRPRIAPSLSMLPRIMLPGPAIEAKEGSMVGQSFMPNNFIKEGLISHKTR